MKNSSIQLKRGFTLIELLLVVTITSVLLFLLILFLGQLSELQQKQRSIREVDEQGSAIMHTLVNTIQSADSVTVPIAGDTSNEIELVMSEITEDPTIFSLSGDTLLVDRGDADAISVHNNYVQVVDFQAENVAGENGIDSLLITLELAYRSDSNRFEYSYQKTWQTTVTLRSYGQ